MAVQGLWASRWMSVLEGIDGAGIASRLTLISGSMLVGFLFMGFFATGLQRRGVRLDRLYLWAMVVALSCFTIICVQPTFAGNWLWPILGACFSLSNISYSLVAQAFPPALSGRANTALNLLVFAGAFGLQWGIGGLVDALQAAGWAVDAAYRTAFFSLLGGQVLALAWLLISGRRR